MPDDATWPLIGAPMPRIEGRAKVTGQALFAADEPVANPAYAYLVTSTIARGRIRSFDLTAAQAVQGVLDILTHENVGDQADPPAPHGPGKRDDHHADRPGSGTAARSSAWWWQRPTRRRARPR